MRMMCFSKRCAREILRDPINLAFGIGFPVVLLLLLSAIQANIPVEMFELLHLTPGITVFGLAFMTLFSATLVARDRESALLERLYTTPMTSADFIIGYMLPIIPISLAQGAACYIVALLIGMQFSINIIFAIVGLIPISIFYVSLGLLCGSVLNVKQVGGICGGLLTNVSAWLSGIWFDIVLVGGAFMKIANLLPFIHAVEMERALLKGSFKDAAMHLITVLIYAVFTTLCAISVFLRQMKKR